MTKRTVEVHPSVTIAYCTEKEKLLMAVYDSGYSQVSYRFSANNIGGNPNPKDGNPRNVLIREIREEYNPEHGEKTNFGEAVLWAQKEDISFVRDSLLKGLKPYKDFFVTAIQLPEDPTTKNYHGIYSTFYSEVPKEAIEIVESNLRKCRRLSSEGLTGVFTLEELAKDQVKGGLSTAHGTALVLNDYFDTKIPYPEQLKAESLGTPRNSFGAYLFDFEYTEKIANACGLKI